MRLNKVFLLVATLFTLTGKASNEWNKVEIPKTLIDGLPPSNVDSYERKKQTYEKALKQFAEDNPAVLTNKPIKKDVVYGQKERYNRGIRFTLENRLYEEMKNAGLIKQEVQDPKERMRKNLGEEFRKIEEKEQEILQQSNETKSLFGNVKDTVISHTEGLLPATKPITKPILLGFSTALVHPLIGGMLIDEQRKDGEPSLLETYSRGFGALLVGPLALATGTVHGILKTLFGEDKSFLEEEEIIKEKNLYFKKVFKEIDENENFSDNLLKLANGMNDKSKLNFIKDFMKFVATEPELIPNTNQVTQIKKMQEKLEDFFKDESVGKFAKNIFDQSVINDALLKAETTGNIEALAEQVNALNSKNNEKLKDQIKKALKTLDGEALTPDKQNNLTEKITDFDNALKEAKKPSFLKRLKEKIKAKFTTIENNNITDFAKENADKPTLLAEILKQVIKQETKANKLKSKENQETSKDIIRRITKDLFTGLEKATEQNGKSFNELGADLFKAIESNNSLRNELSKAGIKNGEDIKNLVKIHIKNKISNQIAEVVKADGEATRKAKRRTAAANDTEGDTALVRGQGKEEGSNGASPVDSSKDSGQDATVPVKGSNETSQEETQEERLRREAEKAAAKADTARETVGNSDGAGESGFKP